MTFVRDSSNAVSPQVCNYHLFFHFNIVILKLYIEVVITSPVIIETGILTKSGRIEIKSYSLKV